MVLTSWPSAITASVVQDFTALPSTCTTQAPHCEVSQPTWVPVRRRFSRRNCTSSVRGSTFAVTGLPFTIMEILAIQGLSSIPNHGVAPQHSQQTRLKPTYGPSRRRATSPRPVTRSARSSLHCLGEVREKFVRELLGGTVDQALAELGELAADLGLDIVGQQRAAILVAERDHGAALGETGNAALAFARDLVAVRRIEIAQGHLALEARRHRADLHLGDRTKPAILGPLQLLATGNAGF